MACAAMGRCRAGGNGGQLAIIGLTNSTLFLGAAWLGLREVPDRG
jgi:hypothetical protein